MKTHELISELVHSAGGALSVACAMGNRNYQGTISRLINGETEQPSPATAKRIAQHFGIPVEALYDENAAQRLLMERRGQAAPPAHPPPKPGLREAVEVVADALDALPDQHRQEAAQRLLTLSQAPDSARAREALVKALSAVGTKRQAAA